MLILTRRVGETLMVGDEVTVTVLGVKGNQVRIGVNAPKDVAVHREEIYDRIQREKDSVKPVNPAAENIFTDECTGNPKRCNKCKGFGEYCNPSKLPSTRQGE